MNLQVLKESMFKCDGVRTHLAILLHKDEHLILLPWAKHIDLQVFFLEGKDLDGKHVYTFDDEFPGLRGLNFFQDVYTQMSDIAMALEWLHTGVYPLGVGGHGKKVYFAHMDLKPNNILIDEDRNSPPSTVGKWVLTDFGISARKENDEQRADGYASVGDISRRLQNLTIKTQPKRGTGTHQPPEVDDYVAETKGSAVSLTTPRERVIGRSGDIWSLGCIFAEVIAFSIGGKTAVEVFQDERMVGGFEDDCFYERRTGTNLSPYGPQQDYLVRRGVMPYLEKLAKQNSGPNRIVECAVRTIEDILQPNVNQRISAQVLQEKIKHVADHIWSSHDLSRCPLTRTVDYPSIPPPRRRGSERPGTLDTPTHGDLPIILHAPAETPTRDLAAPVPTASSRFQQLVGSPSRGVPKPGDDPNVVMKENSAGAAAVEVRRVMQDRNEIQSTASTPRMVASPMQGKLHRSAHVECSDDIRQYEHHFGPTRHAGNPVGTRSTDVPAAVTVASLVATVL